MVSELPSTLRELARSQYGVISRGQATRTGLTVDMIKFRVRSGRWRQAPFARPGGRSGRRDRLYQKYAVVVELDGRLAHPVEAQWRDKARDRAAAAEGIQSLRYGWRDVRQEPCATAIEVAKVLRAHGWDGRPRPCSPGCPVHREFPQRLAV